MVLHAPTTISAVLTFCVWQIFLIFNASLPSHSVVRANAIPKAAIDTRVIKKRPMWVSLRDIVSTLNRRLYRTKMDTFTRKMAIIYETSIEVMIWIKLTLRLGFGLS